MLKDAFGALAVLKDAISAPNALKASFRTCPPPSPQASTVETAGDARLRCAPGSASLTAS
ncbi:hypothetical protein [Amycolatopsis sp. NPDC058986]|uniref:hypothetical protein n=1 Tax=unclassified Amycolatopsis TaxID=2618356 RepID=UPI00366D3B7F